MIRLAAILLACLLAGCGGAVAQSTSEPPLGGAGDRYSKALSAVRDVSGATGGQPGIVNAAFVAHTVTGVAEQAFEWVALHILDNRADAGENVATYSQANALGTGPTWGAVSEATDTSGRARALIAHEFDTFVTGPDNKARMGADLVCGDARYIRGLGRSELAECSTAIRIGATSTTPWATWDRAIEIGPNVRGSPIVLLDAHGTIVFEVKPDGSVWSQGRKL